MTLLHFLILSLAIWRISSLFVNEDGPYQILAELRYRVIRYSTVLDCVWCFSVWVSIIASVAYYFYPDWTVLAMLPFALSTIAVLVEEWVKKNG